MANGTMFKFNMKDKCIGQLNRAPKIVTIIAVIYPFSAKRINLRYFYCKVFSTTEHEVTTG